MAPAATISFTPPSPGCTRFERHHVTAASPVPLSSVVGELSRTRTTQFWCRLPDGETQPCSFVRRPPASSCATEQSSFKLAEARSSSLPCCRKSTATPAQPGFTWGNEGRGQARGAAAYPAGAEEGPAVPWGGYAPWCSRDGERTRPWRSIRKGTGEELSPASNEPSAEDRIQQTSLCWQ